MFQYLIRPIYIGFLCLSLTPQTVFASNDLLKELYLKPADRKASDKSFALDGEFGLLAAAGNTNTTTFKTSLTADHELTKWSNRYFTEFIYRRNEGRGDDPATVTAQRFLTTLQFDYKLDTQNDRMFVYVEYDDDRFNGFRYQAAVAAGYSTTAWKSQSSQFRYSVGPGFSFSEQAHQSNNVTRYEIVKELIARASIDYRYTFSENARFRQFMSAETGQQNRRARSETSISTNVIDSLAMKLSFVMIYNSADIRNNSDLSTETSVSLVYQFF